MKVVVLGAGRSRRFSAAGFAKTKLLLPMPDGRKLLEWQVELSRTKKFILVTSESIRPQLSALIKKINLIGKVDFKVLSLHMETSGPLETAWEARGMMNSDESILILYCDVLPLSPPFTDGEIPLDNFVSLNRDGANARMVIFESDDDRFSDSSLVGFKQSGIYWFRNGKELVEKMRALPKGPENGIPDVYAAYGNKGKEYPWHNMLLADVGVPRDYRAWMAKEGTPLTEDWQIWKKKI